MPLPWKKSKTNRISRIVADLQPPSLVVETGFPTSVVDLFVKNRNRIKRHTFKPKHCPPHVVSESLAPPPTPSFSPDNSLRHAPDVANCSGGGRRLELDDLHRRLNVDVDDVNANNPTNANANCSAFVVAAKMFLAVVPALSTKKLALGITLSAFLLFLLQILGKFALPFFNPYRIRNQSSDGLIDRHRGGNKEEEEEEAPNNEIIQIVEPISSDHEQHIGDGEGPSRENGLRYLDLEVENEEQGIKFQMAKNHQRSRSAKLKAKIINKLIPKKLRSGKRMKRNKKENKTTQLCSEVGGAQDHDDEQEKEQGTESSCEEEDEDQENGEVWEEEDRIWEAAGKMGSTMGKGNLECVFVVVVILLGLLGGRFLALVLTLSGCFFFKFIQFLNHTWKFG